LTNNHNSLSPPLLVGDGIENPWNIEALKDAAQLFHWNTAFIANERLKSVVGNPAAPLRQFTTLPEIKACNCKVICFDSTSSSQSIYGFRPPPLDSIALVVGNERKGIRRELIDQSNGLIQVPMASRRVNSLNVAAAAAIGLYTMGRSCGKIFTRADPERHRPHLLLIPGDDHVELGSTIRSAAALGWKQALIDDRAAIWFGSQRAVQLEGRAAARRSKNTIRLTPLSSKHKQLYDEAIVIRRGHGATKLNRANLAKGQRQIVIVADEHYVDLDKENLGNLARRVTEVHLALPNPSRGYRYRFASAITLAEIARQVGIRKSNRKGPAARFGYRRELRLTANNQGTLAALEDLIEMEDSPTLIAQL
jgi:hypothetical protein